MDSSSAPSRSVSSHLHLIALICTAIAGLVLCQNAESDSYEFKLVPPANEVVHFENDSYIVSCQANGTRLRWLDPNNQWIDRQHGRFYVEERHNESVLIFTSISSMDNGTWTCESERGHRKISLHMIVYKPITFVDTPSIQSAKEDEDAFIKCMVTGDPMPDITWYYNGQALNHDGRLVKIADGLSIKNVLKNDSGEYTCKAFQISPTMSNVKEQTIRLNILHKPMPTVRRESADIQYGYLKGYVNVTCEALAEPPATFQWFRHNKPMKSNHTVNAEHVSILMLHLNNSKMFGEYVCEAKNDLGTLKRTITLLNGTKPAPPPHITVHGHASNTFDLDIGAKKTGKPDPMDITGYRFELQSKEDNRNNGGKWVNPRVVVKGFADGVTYLINDLAANTTYLIRVASFNAAGLSDWMGPKEFRTLAKAESDSHASHVRLPTAGVQFAHITAVLGVWTLLSI